MRPTSIILANKLSLYLSLNRMCTTLNNVRSNGVLLDLWQWLPLHYLSHSLVSSNGNYCVNCPHVEETGVCYHVYWFFFWFSWTIVFAFKK